MSMFAQRNRQSSGALKSNHRKYVKKPSPDFNSSNSTSGAYFPNGARSNQQILQQIAPQLANYRYSEKNPSSSKASTSKLGVNKQDSLINYELLNISQSKNFIADRRKRGKSSFHKKITDINNSQIFFMQNKAPTTKQLSKATSQAAQFTIDLPQNQVQQMHYKLVQFQQKCKKAVIG